MECVISSLWIFLEVLCLRYYFSAFLPPKKARHSKLAILFSIILLLWNIRSSPNGFVKAGITFCVFLFFSFYLFGGSRPWHILITLLGLLLNGVVDTAVLYGTGSLLGLSIAAFSERRLMYVMTITTGKLLAVFLAWMLYRVRSVPRFQHIHGKWLLLIGLFPGVSFILLVVIYYGYRGSGDLSISTFVFSCFLIVANIGILYLIDALEKATQREQELALLNRQTEIQADSIRALEKSYRTQRRSVHEFQHQLQTISDLLSDQRPEAAMDYVRKLQGVQTTRIFCVNSRHPIIDAILNQKYQAAREQNIEIQVEVNNLSGVSIDTDALVVLLSNLLDNAIEACIRLEGNRVMNITMIAGDTLFLSVCNTSPPVTIQNGNIPTSKIPKEEHGYGIGSIRHILNKLHGEYTFGYEDGWFRFAADIPLPE